MICFDPPLCTPCRRNQHADCSYDGEPDCLCELCPEEHKAENIQALSTALDTRQIQGT